MVAKHTGAHVSGFDRVIHSKWRTLESELRAFLKRKNFIRMEEHGKDIIQGTCLEMCPASEVSSREKQRRLHFFETVAFTSPSRCSEHHLGKLIADPRAVIREFSRSAAGRSIDPSELRPANVLLSTMNYLIEEIASKDNTYSWQMIYWFIFDRARAIRQDLVVQRITGKLVMEIFERICRFHILSAYRLCESPLDAFDPKINNDHTNECLKRLLCFYDEEDPSAYRDTRAEFEAYYLLHNLGSFEALNRAVNLPKEVKNSCLLRLAFDITTCIMLKNFVRFFRLVKRLPFLACCAVHKHMQQVRGDALAAINTAYFCRNASLPLALLVDMLNFDNAQDAGEFCSHFGMEVSGTSVKLVKGNLNSLKSSDAPLIRARFSNLIDTKLTVTTRDLLNGKCSETKALVKSSVPELVSLTFGKGICIDQNAAIVEPRSVVKPAFNPQKQSYFGRGRGRGRGKKPVY